MKRVLIILDTPARDLKGVALMTHALAAKHGHRAVVASSKNELAALITHRPHLLLLPHVRYERNQRFLEFARSQGTLVGILPVEGYAGTDALIGKTVIGFEHLHPFVDLIIAWGSHVRDHCLRQPSLAHAQIHAGGCPRFDFLLPSHDSLAPSREDLCRLHGVDPARPIVTWFSSSKYANPPQGFDAWLASFHEGAGKIMKGHVDVAAKGRDHQRAFDYMTDVFRRLVLEHPQLTYFVKPHPAEPREPFVRKLGDLPQVRVLDNASQSTDFVRVTDIQLNWRCMTAGEAWLRNRQARVVSMEPPGLEMHDFAGLTTGNDVVSTYEELKAVFDRYLAGSPVPERLLRERELFIERFLGGSQGAAERCAAIIDGFLRGRPAPRRSLRSWKEIARFAAWRLREGRWTFQRQPGHPKYFPPSEFHGWIGALGRLTGRAVPPSGYRLEV